MTNNILNMPNSITTDIEGLASSYDAGTFIEEHSHGMHQIVHAISGTLRVQASEATWFVPPGRALWMPAHVSHAIRCASKVEMRTVYLNGNHLPARPSVEVIGVSPLMREIMVRISEGCEVKQIPHLKSLLIDEITLMNVETLHLPIPKDVRISRLALYLQEHPDDQTTLASWAKHLGFSQRNLIRRIRFETGMSFRELRRQTRIMVAIEKLSAGQSVTSVALDVGFETPSSFIHAFRLITGSTPRKYVS